MGPDAPSGRAANTCRVPRFRQPGATLSGATDVDVRALRPDHRSVSSSRGDRRPRSVPCQCRGARYWAGSDPLPVPASSFRMVITGTPRFVHRTAAVFIPRRPSAPAGSLLVADVDTPEDAANPHTEPTERRRRGPVAAPAPGSGVAPARAGLRLRSSSGRELGLRARPGVRVESRNIPRTGSASGIPPVRIEFRARRAEPDRPPDRPRHPAAASPPPSTSASSFSYVPATVAAAAIPPPVAAPTSFPCPPRLRLGAHPCRRIVQGR